jgi:hypothetical protein
LMWPPDASRPTLAQARGLWTRLFPTIPAGPGNRRSCCWPMTKTETNTSDRAN